MSSQTANPLVVFLLDTGDEESIQKWASEGHLPTIASIMKRGSWGRITGPEMICEYGISLTLFSGISRAEHGYYYFRQLKPRSYDLEMIEPGQIPVTPFWHDLKDQRVFIMDLPDVEPFPGLAGLQISNWGTHHGTCHGNQATAPKTEPPELLDEVRRIFGPQIIVPADTQSSREELLIVNHKLLDRVNKKASLCEELLDRGPFDLIMIGFSETDPASHLFSDYQESTHPEAQKLDSKIVHPLRDVYQAVDQAMGKLIQKLPANSNIIILSLYGSQDEYPTSNLIDSFCKELGYWVPKKPGKASWSYQALSWGRRLLPLSVRRALGRCIPGTSDRLLHVQLRDGTDWSQTSAFCVPSLYTSFVYVNLAGRQPQGIVQPGREYEAILNRLENDLFQLVDPHDGQPAVRRVARTTELFGGDPHSSLPDLFVEWRPVPWFIDRVIHPRATLTQTRPDHCPSNQEKLTGFLACQAPGMTGTGNLGELSLLDLAPTFLSLLGQAHPASLKGNVVPALNHRLPI